MAQARARDTTVQKLQASSSWSADRGSTVPLLSLSNTISRYVWELGTEFDTYKAHLGKRIHHKYSVFGEKIQHNDSLPRYAAQMRITATLSCRFVAVPSALAYSQLASGLKTLPLYASRALPRGCTKRLLEPVSIVQFPLASGAICSSHDNQLGQQPS